MTYPVDRLLRFRFPVFGTVVPTDQGEAIYASFCRREPKFHELSGLAISPICGGVYANDQLVLDRNTVLYVQAPQSHTGVVVSLAGHSLSIRGAPLRLGPPSLSLIQPAPCLQARFATVKHATEPEAFLKHLYDHLEAVGGDGALAELTRRRILTIHGKKVIGFGVRIKGLGETASLALQIDGFGGRRRFGGGVFLPMREGDSLV